MDTVKALTHHVNNADWERAARNFWSAVPEPVRSEVSRYITDSYESSVPTLIDMAIAFATPYKANRTRHEEFMDEAHVNILAAMAKARMGFIKEAKRDLAFALHYLSIAAGAPDSFQEIGEYEAMLIIDGEMIIVE